MNSSSNHSLIRVSDLASNPATRVPVVLCLDVSGSMEGAPLAELNEGLRVFFAALRKDPVASRSAEVAIVAFAGNAELALDFNAMDQLAGDPQFTNVEWTGTNLGDGVHLAISALERVKGLYRKTGVDYYQPFLVLMTDGAPTTNSHTAAAQKVLALESQRKLVVFPIGIGDGADMNVLAMFSQKRQPMRLNGLDFPAFFEWLSKSVGQVSRSTPGQAVSLPATDGWATI